MNKKGVSHVDFVISLAIFLIYIFGIFLYIKPNFGVVYSNDRMVEIVRDNFEEEVYWVIKKVPLFVENCRPETGKDEDPVTTEVHHDGWGTEKDKFPVKKGEEPKKPFILYFYPLPTTNSDLSLTISYNGGTCDAKLGAISDIKGIDKIKVNYLEGEYGEVKSRWGIPDENDFRILYDNVLIVGKEVTVQTDVYVREFKEFEVSNSGEIKHVVVNIGVW